MKHLIFVIDVQEGVKEEIDEIKEYIVVEAETKLDAMFKAQEVFLSKHLEYDFLGGGMFVGEYVRDLQVLNTSTEEEEDYQLLHSDELLMDHTIFVFNEQRELIETVDVEADFNIDAISKAQEIFLSKHPEYVLLGAEMFEGKYIKALSVLNTSTDEEENYDLVHGLEFFDVSTKEDCVN